MQKLIQYLFLFFIAYPLSAQVDSGYIKCNLNFIESTVALDTSNLNPMDFKKAYDDKFKNWNSCIQNFKAPNFTVFTTFNDTFALEKSLSKIIVLNFWSLNCPPCLIELKVLNALSKEYKQEDVHFVSLTPNSKMQIMDYNYKKITTISNAQDIFDLYGIYGYPQTIILRKNHKIKYQFIGINMKETEKFKEVLKIKINEALFE